MTQPTTKRKYTKKPATQLKKVAKKAKTETIEAIEAVADVPAATAAVVKSYWQKIVDWIKGLVS